MGGSGWPPGSLGTLVPAHQALAVAVPHASPCNFVLQDRWVVFALGALEMLCGSKLSPRFKGRKGPRLAVS